MPLPMARLPVEKSHKGREPCKRPKDQLMALHNDGLGNSKEWLPLSHSYGRLPE